jgi:hypothetical protein
MYHLALNKSPLIRACYGIEREFERYHDRLKKKAKKTDRLKDALKIDHPVLDGLEQRYDHLALYSDF